jgi:hypothetical protein
MAKKSSTKSSTKKGFTNRVHDLTKKDIIASIALVSVLCNVLFLATILVMTNSATFSRGVYTTARDKYCNNISALEQRAEAIGDPSIALEERNIDCISEDFLPFYQEAVEKYHVQSREQ